MIDLNLPFLSWIKEIQLKNKTENNFNLLIRLAQSKLGVKEANWIYHEEKLGLFMAYGENVVDLVSTIFI